MALVYTNDKCIGCNKCIRACSCIGANISVKRDGINRIEVDPEKCIACGACFDVCEHKARDYEDDTERFFEDLNRGEKISLLLAPSFQANYPDAYESVLGGLRAAGVNHIISVSFGADITTWGYLNYIARYGFEGGISQPCPAVVGYVERYVPELLPNLFPVHSPMMCSAIYLTKYMGITDRLAFIGPCIAKKMEIDDPDNGGYVSYNVTFDHLMKYIKRRGVTGPPCTDEIEYGLGAVYPMSGGLRENVQWFLGDDALIRQVEGEKRIYRYLDKYRDKPAGGTIPYLFVDALNCEGGCLYGTGIEEGHAHGDENLKNLYLIRKERRAGKKDGAWSGMLTPEQRLRALNEQFKELDLNDFIRVYTDRSERCRYDMPGEKELDGIFRRMGKRTEEEKAVNCSCCGYETCRDMAVAIHNGFSRMCDCIYYVKKQVETEREKALQLAEEVNLQKQRILRTVEELKQQISVEEAAMECIRILIGEKDIETAIPRLLSIVARFYGARRAYIFEFRPGETVMDNTYEWCGQGIAGEKELLQGLPVSLIENLFAEFEKNGVFYVQKAEREEGGVHGFAYMKKVESLLAAPMVREGKYVGLIGVDNPLLNTEHGHLMQMLASLVLEEMEKRRLIMQLEKLSYSDELTGAGNRNWYVMVMEQFQNKPPERLGIVYADVNGLKKANDTYGHRRGDEILRYAAGILEKYLGGMLFRIGGDEFVSINTDISRGEFEEKIAGLRKYLENETEFGMAVGVQYRENGCNAAEQVIKADKMMYIDKQNYYKRFPDNLHGHRSGNARELMQEIRGGRFTVYLQPKVDLRDRRIVGAEALVRKVDENGRIILPDRFVPACEEKGIIRYIDFFVLERVCSLLSEWKKEGACVPISVNLSRMTLMEYDIVRSVKEVCKRYGIPPRLIRLEITESIHEIDNVPLLRAAEAFRLEGFSLSLDDFGTQYSNLSVLTDFDFDEVKLDRSLVCHLGENTKSDVVVKHAIDMCRSFSQTSSLAEGIETPVQEEILKKFRCEYGQGYLFSRPVEIEEFKKLYVSRNLKNTGPSK